MSCGSSRRLVLLEQPRVPGVAHWELEACAPLAKGLHGRIEGLRLSRDFALLSELREALAVSGLHCACLIAEENQTAGHHAGAEFSFQGFQSTEKAVDRASGRTGGRLIHADREEAAVTPIPPHRQR